MQSTRLERLRSHAEHLLALFMRLLEALNDQQLREQLREDFAVWNTAPTRGEAAEIIQVYERRKGSFPERPSSVTTPTSSRVFASAYARMRAACASKLTPSRACSSVETLQ